MKDIELLNELDVKIREMATALDRERRKNQVSNTELVESEKLSKIEDKLKSIISVTHMKEHPYDCIKVHGKKINFLSRKPKKTNQRQKYDKNFYFIDGSFYLATTKFLRKNKGFFNKKYTKLFIQKRKWPIDIDDADDLKVADSLMTKAKNK